MELHCSQALASTGCKMAAYGCASATQHLNSVLGVAKAGIGLIDVSTSIIAASEAQPQGLCEPDLWDRNRMLVSCRKPRPVRLCFRTVPHIFPLWWREILFQCLIEMFAVRHLLLGKPEGVYVVPRTQTMREESYQGLTVTSMLVLPGPCCCLWKR